jgi:hypothetical protein
MSPLIWVLLLAAERIHLVGVAIIPLVILACIAVLSYLLGHLCGQMPSFEKPGQDERPRKREGGDGS